MAGGTAAARSASVLARCLLLLHADFVLQRAPQLVRGLLELVDAPAERRPSSGSFRGPKMMSAITRMMTISGMPMDPNAYSSQPVAGSGLLPEEP